MTKPARGTPSSFDRKKPRRRRRRISGRRAHTVGLGGVPGARRLEVTRRQLQQIRPLAMPRRGARLLAGRAARRTAARSMVVAELRLVARSKWRLIGADLIEIPGYGQPSQIDVAGGVLATPSAATGPPVARPSWAGRIPHPSRSPLARRSQRAPAPP